MAKRQLCSGLRAPISKRHRTAKKAGFPTGALSTATEPDTAIGNTEGCTAPRWLGARSTGGKGAGALMPTNSLISTEDHVHASHNVVEGLDDGAPMAGTAGVGAAGCHVQASAKPEDAAEVSSSNEVEGNFAVEDQTVVKSERRTKPRSVRGRGAGRASPGRGTGRRGSAAAASTAKKQGAQLSTSVRGRARGKRLASGRGIRATAKPDDPDQVSLSNDVEGGCVVEKQGAGECQRQTKPRSVRGRGAGRASPGTGSCDSAAAAATRKKQGARPSTSVRGGVRGKRLASGRGRGRVKAAAKLRTCQEDQQGNGEGDGVSAAGGNQLSKDKAGTTTEDCEEGGKAKTTRRHSRRAGKAKRETGDIDVTVEEKGTATLSNARAGKKGRAQAKPTRRKPRRAENPKREPGDIDVVVEDQGTATHSNARTGKKRQAQAVVPTTAQCERAQYKAYEVREAFDSFLEDLETTCKQRGVTMTANELQRVALHRWSSMSIKEKADCVARMNDRFSLGLLLSVRPWRLRMTVREQSTPADFVRQSKELYNWGRVRLKVTQSHN